MLEEVWFAEIIIRKQFGRSNSEAKKQKVRMLYVGPGEKSGEDMTYRYLYGTYVRYHTMMWMIEARMTRKSLLEESRDTKKS